MAKQNLSTISGKAGGVIYYVHNGKQYVKARGKRRIKQTNATKASASKFGLISHLSSEIRCVLPDSMRPLNNRDTRNRLTSALVEWMHENMSSSTEGMFENVPVVSRFEFNKEAQFRQKLKFPLKVQWHPGKAIVNIPEIDQRKHVPLPSRHIDNVELWINTISCTVNDGETISNDSIIITIPCRSGTRLISAQQIELPVSDLSDTISIVAAGLEYLRPGGQRKNRITLNDTRWMPARILDAVYKAD